jgi:phosphoheptose isomerase
MSGLTLKDCRQPSSQVDFENIVQKLTKLQLTDDWRELEALFRAARQVYFIGNGGNLSTASHSAADVARLTDKSAFAPDSSVLITALANDLGYDAVFSSWLSCLTGRCEEPQTKILIAYSGSGASPNVLNCLRSADERGIQSVLITSVIPAGQLPRSTLILGLGVKFYHSYECLSLMITYALIRSAGFDCPTIVSTQSNESTVS